VVVESSMGDRGPEDQRLDQQMAAHDGLVYWVGRQQWRGDLPFDEAVHAGRIGLWHALGGYDPARGTRFSTYAVPAITRAVWTAVARCARETSQREPRGPGADAAGLDLTEPLDRAQRAVALRALVGDLPARLRQVIVAHYGLDARPPQSFAAIGSVLGVSRQRVQQLQVTALLWLAHPDHSRPVRRLLERQRRPDYQQALAHQRQRARAQRTGRRPRR
jgi:RNA polymerase sigma factor (sigma-70 family)